MDEGHLYQFQTLFTLHPPVFNIPRNIALVVNPFHPKALLVAKVITSILQEKNIEHTHFTTQWPDIWIDFTEAWIIGGDGTLNYFINHYPVFDLPIAIFKGGTGNDFHWLLYGTISIEQQVEVVLNATPRPLDAGLCNNRLFINSVGIGFSGKVVSDLAGKKKKKTSYLRTILKTIFRYKAFLCTVNTNGFHWGKKCFMITVANGRRYGGGFPVLPKSLLRDGLLDINIVGNIHPLFRMRYLPLVQKEKHLDLPLVTYVKSSMIIVKALQQVSAQVDGEVFTASEFNIECLPGRFMFLYVLHPPSPGERLDQQ